MSVADRVRVAFSNYKLSNCIVNNFSRATKIFAKQRSEFTIHLFWSSLYALRSTLHELLPVCSFHLPRFTAFILFGGALWTLSASPTVKCTRPRAHARIAQAEKAKLVLFFIIFFYVFVFYLRLLSGKRARARHLIFVGLASGPLCIQRAWGMNTWWMITKCIHFVCSNVARPNETQHNCIWTSERSY